MLMVIITSQVLLKVKTSINLLSHCLNTIKLQTFQNGIEQTYLVHLHTRHYKSNKGNLTSFLTLEYKRDAV